VPGSGAFSQDRCDSINELRFRLATKNQLPNRGGRERQISPCLTVSENATFLLVLPTWILCKEQVADMLVETHKTIHHWKITVIVNPEGVPFGTAPLIKPRVDHESFASLDIAAKSTPCSLLVSLATPANRSKLRA
jgi:hypothetical protein